MSLCSLLPHQRLKFNVHFYSGWKLVKKKDPKQQQNPPTKQQVADLLSSPTAALSPAAVRWWGLLGPCSPPCHTNPASVGLSLPSSFPHLPATSSHPLHSTGSHLRELKLPKTNHSLGCLHPVSTLGWSGPHHILHTAFTRQPHSWATSGSRPSSAQLGRAGFQPADAFPLPGLAK